MDMGEPLNTALNLGVQVGCCKCASGRISVKFPPATHSQAGHCVGQDRFPTGEDLWQAWGDPGFRFDSDFNCHIHFDFHFHLGFDLDLDFDFDSFLLSHVAPSDVSSIVRLQPSFFNSL